MTRNLERPPGAGAEPGPTPPRAIELRWHVWIPLLSLMAILLSATRTDPDLWGHVRFGLDWLAARQLPSIDPYSFTQDRPWVNHEWLSEALMAAAFKAGGSAGLVAMKMVVVSGALFVLWRRLRGSSPLIVAVTLTTAAVAALPLTATLRPQIWSLLALALLVPLLGVDAPPARRMVESALLFGLWANLHGGWITGGAVLALHIAIRTLRAPRQAPAWIALGATSLAATLVNPYGIGLWRFLASTVRASRPDITEWRAFGVQEPAIMWVSIVAPIVLLATFSARRESRPAPETVAVVALLVAAGLRVSRVAPLMCPAALALLAPHIRQAWGSRWQLTAPTAAAALVLLAPSALAPAIAWNPVHAVMTCLPTHDEWAPDTLAAASLTGATGRLWTTFNWGQFALWHFGPALKVSIDGRRETVYSDAVIDWNRAVESGSAPAIEKMAAVRPEYVWLPASRRDALHAIVEKGYRMDVESPASFVLTRADLPRLPANQAPLSTCFP
jgi:hypothetical protein